MKNEKMKLWVKAQLNRQYEMREYGVLKGMTVSSIGVDFAKAHFSNLYRVISSLLVYGNIVGDHVSQNVSKVYHETLEARRVYLDNLELHVLRKSYDAQLANVVTAFQLSLRYQLPYTEKTMQRVYKALKKEGADPQSMNVTEIIGFHEDGKQYVAVLLSTMLNGRTHHLIKIYKTDERKDAYSSYATPHSFYDPQWTLMSVDMRVGILEEVYLDYLDMIGKRCKRDDIVDLCYPFCDNKEYNHLIRALKKEGIDNQTISKYDVNNPDTCTGAMTILNKYKIMLRFVCVKHRRYTLEVFKPPVVEAPKELRQDELYVIDEKTGKFKNRITGEIMKTKSRHYRVCAQKSWEGIKKARAVVKERMAIDNVNPNKPRFRTPVVYDEKKKMYRNATLKEQAEIFGWDIDK